MNENWRGDKRRRKSGQNSRPFPKEGRPSEKIHSHDRRNDAGQNFGGRCGGTKKTAKEQEKNDKAFNARSKWTGARLRTDPIPAPLCAYCKEPVKDLAAALTDKEGNAIHFECVQKHIALSESLGKGDTVTYIGGGRFGIVRFENPNIPRKFTIKKIIEWERKDQRAPWRGHIADHFSYT
ncbi:MAG: hypothetical protein LBO04_06275 [Spirochaetaceae bacterium]|nr:hypothetical protein [Spirochaetaceae bacterium]